MKNKPTFIIIAIGAIILLFLSFTFLTNPENADNASATALAQCLDESGAAMYGAFWCSHCQNQKAAFGQARDDLPYIECSTPDGRGQTEACQEAGIRSYPTWEFAGGKRLTGELSLERLSEESGCSI